MDDWNAAIREAGKTLWDVDLAAAELQPLLEPPADPKHGDATCRVCLKLARKLKKAPRSLAEELTARLQETGIRGIEKFEIAGPGFINLHAGTEYYLDLVSSVREADDRHGRSKGGDGKGVLIEHTSANPTGPLHIAHGRQAAIGDAVATLLDWTGHKVFREYYINDAGNQIRMLGESLHARIRQVADPSFPFPEKGYHGDYVTDLARELREKEGDRWDRADREAALTELSDIGRKALLKNIEKDLSDFGVEFNGWYSERELRDSGRVEKVVKHFEDGGFVFEKDGARYLRTTEWGDIQDWVLVKSDGSYTYRTPDFAYHLHKFERGHDRVVDVMGPDHKAHADTMAIVMRQMGHPDLQVLFPQHCRLLRGKEEVKFSKRAGNIVSLRELMEETGVDAARFFFLMRKVSTPLDFDIEVAKKQTLENPVYYVQNAHARVCSIWAKGIEKGMLNDDDGADGIWRGPLDKAALGPAEIEVLREAARFEKTVENAARDLDPARICTYLTDLAGRFHRYYQNRDNIILAEDPAIRIGRLAMATIVRIVLRNGLAILGVDAPIRMDRLDQNSGA